MDTAASDLGGSKRRLGDIFVERGLITDEQLQEALAQQREQGGKLGEILVELGYTTRIELAGAISQQWTSRGLTTSGRKAQEQAARVAARSTVSVVETALRQRVESLESELAAREERIRKQAATIDALLARVAELEQPAV